MTMREPIDPRVARVLLETAKANSEIAHMLILLMDKVVRQQGDAASTTKLLEQQKAAQDAVERQIAALNEALDG